MCRGFFCIFAIMKKINIYRSRKHLTLAMVGSTGFVCLGVFMLTRPDVSPTGHTIALVTTIFFGLCSFAGGYFLFRKKNDPMVVLSPEILTLCNADGSSYQIPWREITDIEAKEWHAQIFLLIRITNPDKAVAEETNPDRRKVLEINNGLFGTPYTITPSALEYPKGALLPMLKKLHRKYGNL